MTVNRTEGHTEVLLEIVLGFLSRSSALQRKLSEQVFASFASSLTSTGLELLLDVLQTPETVSGAGELFNKDMDDEMEDEDEEDADELDEEDEEDDMDEDDEQDEAADVDEDMDDADDDADEELDAALSAALGTTKATENGDDDNSSEEELMDDDEMMALDDNLATIFRQRLKPNHKKEVKDTKEQISTFKCKVIDLLEILVKEQSALCLDMILPLLQVLRLTKNDTVHSKTINLLRKLAKNKELPDAPENLMSLLRKIHEDAAKARNKDGNIHSQLSIYIARIARKAGQEEDVIGVYAETMRIWIKNGKSMVRAGLFADWVNWCQSIRR
jgi:DNA polymerase phi